MTARNALCAAVTVIALTGAPIYAHHSFAMFDMDKDVKYTGVVVDIKPGANIDPATVGTWDVEGGSTNIMGRQGWTRATFKAGDPITLVGHPMKDGSKGVSLFYVILPDGKRLYHDIARPKDDSGR